MKTNKTSKPKPACFVVMGFGKKTDFETGRVLDLDKSYRNLIRPAVEGAGLLCERADELVHSGLIDVPMYEKLLQADVVVVDLSTSNRNAYYELGVRHALRPSATILIAEGGSQTLPFDINHVVVRRYEHLGTGIDYDEVERFRAELTKAIKAVLAQPKTRQPDSPVYWMLPGLVPPALPLPVGAPQALPPAGRSVSTPRLKNSLRAPAETLPELPAAAPPEPSAPTYASQMADIEQHIREGRWQRARTQLEALRTQQQQARQAALGPKRPSLYEDPYLLQSLALATYRSQLPTEAAALQAARNLLLPLKPATTNDPETLGVWGDIHKRRWQLAVAAGTQPAAAAPDLEEAVRAYERGFYLRNDAYNGINLAFMLNQRASRQPDPAEAIADFVLARRLRREVLGICAGWLSAHPAPPPGTWPTTPEQLREAKDHAWMLAIQAEAYLGLGEQAASDQALAHACDLTPKKWLPDTVRKQLAELQAALANDPLRYVQA